MRKYAGGLCAATFLSVQSIAPLAAAPDNTLGMAMMYAVVSANGTLARGSGATGATGGNGQYAVQFDRSLVDCAYTATVDAPGGVAHFVQPNGISGAVHVDTRNFAGNLTALPFHLIVFCAK